MFIDYLRGELKIYKMASILSNYWNSLIHDYIPSIGYVTVSLVRKYQEI